MESRARLDYVLFHLTPTRTRCDLVIFAGKSNEKLAYGLLEPFITHLRSARDQISKGGYSVTLRPSSLENSHWFTKGTLQRFVRFVSTPEVLERFVTIEREISQLENSIQSFESPSDGAETDGNGGGCNSKTAAVSSKRYGESNDGDDFEKEENSKARLHRVVETRKVVLRKEQAMVYARALAAGFEMDNLNDLLLFSDAFGASRLREACVNFRDLCKKKNEDRHWVDEIAAMQAMMQPDLSFMGTSGVVLAGDDNDPFTAEKPDNSISDSIPTHGSSDAIQASQTPGQMQNPWAKQFPAHLRNFQGPMFQQMHPYQGYGFPGMQVAPPYYPTNRPWPSDGRDSHDRRDRKSSSKKEKPSKARESENEEHDGNTEPGEISTETDSSSDRSNRKKNGRKSSRKVVIRNINYISSKRDGEKKNASETNSSDEEDYLDGDSIKQQLEEAVGSFEKHHKSLSRHHRKRNGSKHENSVDNSVDQSGNKGSESWDAFQQLLLKEDSDSNVPEAKRSDEGNTPAFTDVILVTEKCSGSYVNVGKISDERFEHSEGHHPEMRRGSNPEEFPFSQRNIEPESIERASWSDDAARSSVIKTHASDDWFFGKQSDRVVNQGEFGHLLLVDGVYVTSSADQVEKRNKNAVIDDSLMIQGRFADDYSKGQLCTDISMVSDITEASFVEKGATEEAPQKVPESQGFYEPDELYMVLDRNTTVDQTVPSWNPEIDFENNVLVNNPAKKSDKDACDELNSIEKAANKKAVTKASSRDARSRTAGGAIRRGKTETTPVPRRSTFGSKTTTPKSQLQKDEERRKRMEELLVRRQKRIAERASGNSVTASLSSDKLKRQPSAEERKKPKAILRASTIDRLAVAKKAPNSPALQPRREASKLKDVNVKSGYQKTREVHVKKSNTKKISPSEEKPENADLMAVHSFTDVKEAKLTENIDKVDDSKDVKELHVTSSTINNDVLTVIQMMPSDEKVEKPLGDHSEISDSVTKNDDEVPKQSISFPEERKVFDDHDEISPELCIHPVPESPTKHVAAGLILEGNGITKAKNSDSPVSAPVIPESTPPTTNETTLESTQLRKKWDGPENSPKAAKGFRKLLMFGWKS